MKKYMVCALMLVNAAHINADISNTTAFFGGVVITAMGSAVGFYGGAEHEKAEQKKKEMLKKQRDEANSLRRAQEIDPLELPTSEKLVQQVDEALKISEDAMSKFSALSKEERELVGKQIDSFSVQKKHLNEECLAGLEASCVAFAEIKQTIQELSDWIDNYSGEQKQTFDKRKAMRDAVQSEMAKALSLYAQYQHIQEDDTQEANRLNERLQKLKAECSVRGALNINKALYEYNDEMILRRVEAKKALDKSVLSIQSILEKLSSLDDLKTIENKFPRTRTEAVANTLATPSMGDAVNTTSEANADAGVQPQEEQA